MAEVFTVLYLVLLSSVKFFVVPFLSINFYHYSFFTSVIINTIGGVIGSTFFLKHRFSLFSAQLKKGKKKLKLEQPNPKKNSAS
jgi:hypothetical protein